MREALRRVRVVAVSGLLVTIPYTVYILYTQFNQACLMPCGASISTQVEVVRSLAYDHAGSIPRVVYYTYTYILHYFLLNTKHGLHNTHTQDQIISPVSKCTLA